MKNQEYIENQEQNFDELLNELYALETKARAMKAIELEIELHFLRKDIEKNGIA